jgi:hypothetical protein
MRTFSLVPFVALLLASSTAWADHNPSTWYLDQVINGEFDGYEGSIGNTVTRIEVLDNSGEMELSACCNPDDCAGSGSNTYLITWEVMPNATDLTRGETLDVYLTNELIGGVGCPDIDPFISTCGQEGSPASQITEQNITFDYPSNSLTYANCDRFYPDPVKYANVHVPSPHQVHLYDHDNMPHDGYWWLNITHRWGMQYEIVWIYRTAEMAAGGAGNSGGADSGAGGTGSIDVGDSGIAPDLPPGGASNDAGVKPSGSNGGEDAVDTLNPVGDQDAGAAHHGGGGGGGCSLNDAARGNQPLLALLLGAAFVARRRRALAS